MNINNTKYELQNILSGKSGYSHDAVIQTVAGYLRRSKKTGSLVEKKFKDKEEEKKKLIDIASKKKCFVKTLMRLILFHLEQNKKFI